MAVEPIHEQRRPNFPKETVNENSYLTTIEYVGIAEDLRSVSPNINATWGEYNGRVTVSSLDPIETSEWGILTVVVEYKLSAGEGGEAATEGTLLEVTTEIDWVDVQRSLYEHPEFRIGGGGTYALTSEDVTALAKWEQMDKVADKKDYKYYLDGANGETGTLTANAKMFAKGRQSGIEYYIDKAPVARWSGNYAGGPPPAGSAGQKQDPSGVEGVPSGYEWVRNADRGIKQGGQTRWVRNIEWVGCKEVLLDVDEIFWAAP